MNRVETSQMPSSHHMTKLRYFRKHLRNFVSCFIMLSCKL